jgi:hypothetical protein
MSDVPIITQDELVERIKTRLESRSHSPSYSHYNAAPAPTEPAAYVLILGAGFSYGIVPLAGELMQQTIGDYYYPDQDQWGRRPTRVLKKDSARFWSEFNRAAAKEKLPVVDLDDNGLPTDPGAAYQNLFTYEGANVLFALIEPKKKKKTLVERILQAHENGQSHSEQRREKPNIGERFVKGFLRYVLDPGAEAGYGSTGRSQLNPAHIYLAALLEAQQLGRGWKTCVFCRTIFTTNFDTLLQNALQMFNLLYCLTDKPEKGLDRSDFHVEDGPIHLVYVHGSILRHNPASTIGELSGLAGKNIEVLRDYLKSYDVIVVGYSGWNDGLMAALGSCDSTQHMLYWCDINSEPTSRVANVLRGRAGGAAYVHLGKGSDDLMRALYEKLIPPEGRRVPIQRYRDWCNLA